MRSPNRAAISNKNVNVAKYLVSRKADVNAKNMVGQTSLELARRNDNTEIVKYRSGLKQ